MAIIVLHLEHFWGRIILDFVKRKQGGGLWSILDRNVLKKIKTLVYPPLELDSVYHLCLSISIDSLPMKVMFLPLEADVDAQVMALQFGGP